MAKPVSIRKPALAKPAASKPTVGKSVKVPKAAAKAPAKPLKETKPFNDGDIVVFKGYKKQPENVLFTEGEELAIVGQSLEGDTIMLAAVKVADYHKFKEDAESVNGQQIMSDEVKRTNKTVPPLYHLPVIGDMSLILKSDSDPRDVAIHLYDQAERSYFYLGGILCKLYKEKDGDTGKSVFTNYQNASGKGYEDSKEGFEAFVKDTFGDDFGGFRKAQYTMSIYEAVSSLTNAASVIKELPAIGWWKATKLAAHITDANAAALVKLAKDKSLTFKAFDETLKTQYTTEGGITARGHQAARAVLKKTTFAFKLYEDAGAGVEYIMNAASKQMGISDLNQVFERITQEWASEHLGEIAAKAQAAVDKKRRAAIKSGVKLPADHPAAQQAEAAE